MRCAHGVGVGAALAIGLVVTPGTAATRPRPPAPVTYWNVQFRGTGVDTTTVASDTTCSQGGSIHSSITGRTGFSFQVLWRRVALRMGRAPTTALAKPGILGTYDQQTDSSQIGGGNCGPELHLTCHDDELIPNGQPVQLLAQWNPRTKLFGIRANGSAGIETGKCGDRLRFVAMTEYGGIPLGQLRAGRKLIVLVSIDDPVNESFDKPDFACTFPGYTQCTDTMSWKGTLTFRRVR